MTLDQICLALCPSVLYCQNMKFFGDIYQLEHNTRIIINNGHQEIGLVLAGH